MRENVYDKNAYESWKEATSSKTSGKMKLRRDQSSAKLFYKNGETYTGKIESRLHAVGCLSKASSLR
jgi:hypothetical protein